jgi:K+-transporting ATPase ATPase C chain
VKGRIQALRDADPGNTNPVPVDLVTASASGLDPHISVAAARYQVQRIARVRKLDAQRISALLDAATEQPTLRLLGEPGVNVLRLNLALDALPPQ